MSSTVGAAVEMKLAVGARRQWVLRYFWTTAEWGGPRASISEEFDPVGVSQLIPALSNRGGCDDVLTYQAAEHGRSLMLVETSAELVPSMTLNVDSWISMVMTY